MTYVWLWLEVIGWLFALTFTGGFIWTFLLAFNNTDFRVVVNINRYGEAYWELGLFLVCLPIIVFSVCRGVIRLVRSEQ